MADTSKKLTVSFGAFSCTLAGFDDPFPIMKRVVDYFQQLAAADPSFGATPQAPDTNVLRDIAQEQSAMNVTAELVNDEVVLQVDQSIETVGIDLPDTDRAALWSAMEIDALEEVGLEPTYEVAAAPSPAVEPEAEVETTSELEVQTEVEVEATTEVEVHETPVAETVDEKQARIDAVATAWSPTDNQAFSPTEAEAAIDSAALKVATDAYAEVLLDDFKAEQAEAALPTFIDAPESDTEIAEWAEEESENAFDGIEDIVAPTVDSAIELSAATEFVDDAIAEPEIFSAADDIANAMAEFEAEAEAEAS